MSKFEPFVDLSGIKEEVFEPVPAGEYLCEVVNAECKYKEGGEYPYWNVTFEILQGEEAGRKFWGIFSFSPEALKFGAKSSILALVGNPADARVHPENDVTKCIGSRLIAKVNVKKRAVDGEELFSNNVRSLTPATQTMENLQKPRGSQTPVSKAARRGSQPF